MAIVLEVREWPAQQRQALSLSCLPLSQALRARPRARRRPSRSSQPARLARAQLDLILLEPTTRWTRSPTAPGQTSLPRRLRSRWRRSSWCAPLVPPPRGSTASADIVGARAGTNCVRVQRPDAALRRVRLDVLRGMALRRVAGAISTCATCDACFALAQFRLHGLVLLRGVRLGRCALSPRSDPLPRRTRRPSLIALARLAVSQDRSFYYLSSGNIAWNALSVLNGLIAALSKGFLAIKAGFVRPFFDLFSRLQRSTAALTDCMATSISSSRVDRIVYCSGRGRAA